VRRRGAGAGAAVGGREGALLAGAVRTLQWRLLLVLLKWSTVMLCIADVLWV